MNLRWRALGVAGAAFLLLLGGLRVGQAWVFGVDDRVRSQAATVGTLAVRLPEGEARGTAVLVDGCGILTNFHVVFGPWTVTALRPPTHDFPGTFTLATVTQSDGAHPAAVAIPVVWGDYRGPDRQFRRPQEDWAYLALDPCLGRTHGWNWMRALTPDEAAGGIAAIGYSAGSQMADPACTLVERTAGTGVWLHDCTVLAGDSGGPLLQRGTLTVVALSSGAGGGEGGQPCPSAAWTGRSEALRLWTRGCANRAVPLSWPVIDRIRAAAIAVAVQRQLLARGLDAGPLGAIEDPRLAAAIAAFEQAMGLPVSGRPTCALQTILELQAAGA